MSKRKIRKKGGARREANRGGGKEYLSSFILVKEPGSPVPSFRNLVWEVEEDVARYMSAYQRAHELMPPPRNMYMDPQEYREEQEPAIETLDFFDEGISPSRDELLRAIAILGHSPNEQALLALSRFSESGHELAPVARLALSECTGLYSIFSPAERAAGTPPVSVH
jgi:hypothetical protein